MTYVKNVKSISILADLEEFIGEQGKSTMMAVSRRIITETPMDTGQAKLNWIPTVDRETNEVIDATGMTISDAQSVAIDKAQSVFMSASNYKNLILTNNLPYIQRLDNGWSQQQPNPFIDRIISEEVNR